MTDPLASGNLETVKMYLAGVAAGDLTVVDRLMAEDVEYTVISAHDQDVVDALPWVGRRQGREAVKSYLRRLQAVQPTVSLDWDGFVADGDTVVAFALLRSRAAATGKQGTWELAFRFTLSDGRITRYHLYEDSYLAVLLHRTGGSWTLDREGETLALPAT